MNVIVTGGLGFIGSNLVKRLVDEGHSVSVLDNLHTGSRQNLEGLLDRVSLIEGRSKEIARAGENAEIIFHQGIYSSTPMYRENPFLISEVLEDFISILEYAKSNNSRIVFASSSSVYNGVAPPHREDAALKVKDFYTEARIAMERVAEVYNQLYGVKTVGLRYFSVYGPNEKSKKQYANLVSQFIWEVNEGRNPVIYGDGKQTRDFTYVEDVVDANLAAAEKGIGFGIFNVGTGKSTSLNELVSILGKQMGKNVEAEYVENPLQNYVHDTLADTSKAESILGFRAKVKLEEGIRNILESG